MGDGVHQVSFTKAGAAVNKKRVIFAFFSGEFGNCERSRMCEAVVVSDDEGFKGVKRI